jgi:hypothetical protein
MNNEQGCEVGPGANGTGSSEIQPENLPRRVSLPSRRVQSKEVKIKLAHTSVFFMNKNFWMKKSPLSKGKRNPSFTLLMLHLIAEPPVKLINVYGLCVCTKKIQIHSRTGMLVHEEMLINLSRVARKCRWEDNDEGKRE